MQIAYPIMMTRPAPLRRTRVSNQSPTRRLGMPSDADQRSSASSIPLSRQRSPTDPHSQPGRGPTVSTAARCRYPSRFRAKASDQPALPGAHDDDAEDILPDARGIRTDESRQIPPACAASRASPVHRSGRPRREMRIAVCVGHMRCRPDRRALLNGSEGKSAHSTRGWGNSAGSRLRLGKLQPAGFDASPIRSY